MPEPCRCCIGCTDWVEEELRPENITTRHTQPELFVTTQWTKHQGWYAAYRVLVAGVLLAWGIYDYIVETMVFYAPRYGLWFVFATDWAFLVLIITSIYSAILVLWSNINTYKQRRPQTDAHGLSILDNNSPEGSEGLPIKLQVFWFLNTISTTTILAISFSFWTFLTFLDHKNFLNTTSSQAKHTVTAVVAVLDLLLGGVPVRILHVIYPVLSAILYVIFTAIYYALGGRGPDWDSAIYPVLAWKSPAEALVTFGLEVLLIISLHCIAYLIYRFRLFLQKKCLPRTSRLCCDHGDLSRSLKEADTNDYNSVQKS